MGASNGSVFVVVGYGEQCAWIDEGRDGSTHAGTATMELPANVRMVAFTWA
jgi:hypothetical protein